MPNELIAITNLNVSGAYQRTVKRSRVVSIKQHYDPDAVGSLCVGRRADGSLWVVDGQQRLTALKEMGVECVSCDVFESAGIAHEAKVFRHKNKDRTGITVQTIFNALLTEGDEMAVRVQACIESFGLHIKSGNAKWPNVRCITAVIAAYERGGIEHVRQVFSVIVNAWAGEDGALHGSIVDGLSIMLSQHPGMDHRRIERVLSRKPPEAISRAADGYKLWSGSRGKAVAEAILAVYNKGLRNKIGQRD